MQPDFQTYIFINENKKTMKKLMLLIAACCFVFVACNNKTAETEEPTTDSTEVVAEQPQEEACCPMMKDWAEFDTKTVEEQTALVEKRAECINKILAEVNLDEIQCPKAKTELPAFIEKWNKEFAGADLTAKKVLIDEFDTFKCLKPQHKDGCCKHEGECKGDCKDKCNHECKDNCKDNCKCEKK